MRAEWVKRKLAKLKSDLGECHMDIEDLEPHATQILPLSRQDLSVKSIEELEERIDELKAEMNRCQDMIKSKQGSRVSAETFFKK